MCFGAVDKASHLGSRAGQHCFGCSLSGGPCVSVTAVEASGGDASLLNHAL